MTEVNIPEKVVDAVARAIHAQEYDEENYPFEREATVMQHLLRKQARAACLAMINSWPGMHEARSDRLDSQIIILPLPEKGEG